MKKYSYLARLEELLDALPAEERQDALNYYEEFFDASGAEDSAAAGLEPPEEAARKILEGEGIAPPAPRAEAAPEAAPAAPPHRRTWCWRCWMAAQPPRRTTWRCLPS